MALFLRIQQYAHQRQLRRERVFLDRNNHLETLNDQGLISKYRLPRRCILDLCEVLRVDLERPTRRNNALTVSQQVLVALRFYATGSFQTVIGDTGGLS